MLLLWVYYELTKKKVHDIIMSLKKALVALQKKEEEEGEVITWPHQNGEISELGLRIRVTIKISKGVMVIDRLVFG